MTLRRSLRHLALVALALPMTGRAHAQQTPAAPVSAPLGNIRYEITFDTLTAQSRRLQVAMNFDVTGPGRYCSRSRHGRRAPTS